MARWTSRTGLDGTRRRRLRLRSSGRRRRSFGRSDISRNRFAMSSRISAWTIGSSASAVCIGRAVHIDLPVRAASR